MDTLRGYSGWGGCADAFSDKPEWRTIRDAIEQALTPEEYTQARASTLTAYYTPGPVVKAMWDALRIGPTPIQVLEPGCGTGCVCSIESGPCERVESLQMSGRF